MQLQLLTADIVLTQFYLQQIVTHGYTSAYGHIHIFMYIAQKGIHSLDGLHLFLQRSQLPEILLGSFLYFVF